MQTGGGNMPWGGNTEDDADSAGTLGARRLPYRQTIGVMLRINHIRLREQQC